VPVLVGLRFPPYADPARFLFGGMITMKATLVLVTAIAWLASVPVLDDQAAGASVRWYVVHQALNEQSQSLNIGDGVVTLELRGGWSCLIGATWKLPGLPNSRETTCRAGDKSSRFSVGCESRRPKDDKEIRFVNIDGRILDFIAVGCELRD
jgi:hypothetical protein